VETVVLSMLEQEGSLQGLSEVWKGMEKASKGREVAMSLAGDEVREQVKQARAEVLAACAKVTCFRCAEGNKPCDNGTTWLHFLEKKVGNVTESWNEECEAAPIRSLQPAAKALEALLREAEVKGIRWAEGRDIAQITARLNELEKARASDGKGGE